MPTHLLGDGGRLRQVLVNLIGNAVKFSTQGEVVLHVATEADSPERATLRFRITDSGIGIPPEVQARLFQAFTQADESTTRKHGGTGLGLAICKQLVTQMDGEIGVESSPGNGSTFWFTITLAKQEKGTVPSPEPAAASAVVSRGGDLAHGRVLVAEDNPVNQRIITHLLGKLGYTADLVSDGLEVLEALRHVAYDVILMDCRMPKLDGFETTALIRAQGGPQPHIIALTANAMRGDKEACLAAGMDGYVSKPVRPAALQAALQKSARRPATVDQSALARLQGMAAEGMPEIYAELIQLFADSTPALLRQARAHLQDADQLAGIAHTIKGSCSNFGAVPLQQLCEELETLCRSGDITRTDTLVAAIEQEYERVRAALEDSRVAA